MGDNCVHLNEMEREWEKVTGETLGKISEGDEVECGREESPEDAVEEFTMI